MLSIPHLIIVFVVALVVFGPEKLPELARNLGKLMGEFRRATGDLRSTFEGHLRDLEREADQRRIGGATTSPAVHPAQLPSNAQYSALARDAEAEISTALASGGHSADDAAAPGNRHSRERAPAEPSKRPCNESAPSETASEPTR